MSENKAYVTADQVGSLQNARKIYQDQMRGLINLRSKELWKFGQMQSSRIMRPNQTELMQQHEKVQKIDFEIKRLSDLAWCATLLITFHVKPELLDGMDNVKHHVKMAMDVVFDVKKDLEKTSVEEVFALSIVRDMGQFLPSLYPETNPVEEAGRLLASQDPLNQRTDKGVHGLDSGVSGQTGSLLVSV